MNVDIELLNCIQVQLNSNDLTKGYIIGNELSRGANGIVYNLNTTSTGPRNTYIIKVIRFELYDTYDKNRSRIEQEYEFGRRVGEVNLGAQYINHNFCYDKHYREKVTLNEYLNEGFGPQDKEYIDHEAHLPIPGIDLKLMGWVGWIVMSYLPGVILSQNYPWDPWMLTEALNAYYSLITKYNIAQYDYGGHNVMVDNDMKRVYLIDFEMSSNYNNKKNQIIDQLISDDPNVAKYSQSDLDIITLRIYMFEILGELVGSPDFRQIIDHNQRTSVMLNWIDAANQWYSSVFKLPPGYYIMKWGRFDAKSMDDQSYQQWLARQGKQINPNKDTW